MKEIFLEDETGRDFSFSPRPPPSPKKLPTLRQVTFVLFQRLRFPFKSKKRSLYLCLDIVVVVVVVFQKNWTNNISSQIE